MATLTVTTFFFSPFSSPFLIALSSITLVSILILVSAEFLGNHVQYSKFWNPRNSSNQIHLHSRSAMLLCYVPAFFVSFISFFLSPHQIHSRISLVKLVFFIHYFKRIFEVLLVHKYSNKMALNGAILTSISYVLFTTSTIYAQMVSQDLAEPQINLKPLGLALYSIGITGNFYHHLLLSKLRKDGDRDYKIPRGGLFELIVCPHYLFEIIEFFGISFVSQTVFAFISVLGSTLFLVGRSYATRHWYFSKFEDFPRHVKAIVPFVF